jgi:uncharacterized lipoprotein YajG
MKKYLLVISIVVAASVLVLTACNRPNLRQGGPNPAADTAQTQATQAPAATMQQSGDSSASNSAISTELNDLSDMFDSLANDLNSTDTLSDFK